MHTTVMSNVRGENETVLDTLPDLHFPVTGFTAGAEGSCRLFGLHGLLDGPPSSPSRRRMTCLMSLTPDIAGQSLSERAISDLVSLSTSSDLYNIVTGKSLHFLTSTDSSLEDEVSASKLKYTDDNDVWSIEQRESTPPRGSIWLGGGDAGGSDITGHGGWT